MASHALKQVRPHVYFPFERRNKPVFLFLHRRLLPSPCKSANECAAFHAQSQHTRRASVFTVLALGKAASGLKVPTATGPPVWKILVLDQETKDILATVLRVQDRRDIGVTLHVYAFPLDLPTRV